MTTTPSQIPDHAAIYRALRASGRSALTCAELMMRDHGLTCPEAADLGWRMETGKPAPIMDPESPRWAAWYAGHEQAHVGSDE